MTERLESMDDITNDTEEEKLFRDRYSHELRNKKQHTTDSYQGHNELEEERKQVNQQVMKTPGRRGEAIKKEEIDKEIARRYRESKNKKISK